MALLPYRKRRFKSCQGLCSLAIKKCSDETDGLHRRQGRELTVARQWTRSTETVTAGETAKIGGVVGTSSIPGQAGSQSRTVLLGRRVWISGGLVRGVAGWLVRIGKTVPVMA